jgi:signal transduction histidine kinase/streptogramin lyase
VRAPTGLYLFPPGDPLVALTRKPRLFAKGTGLPVDRTSRVFVDSRDDVWVGVWDPGQNTVVRRDGRTGAFDWIPTPASWGPGRVPNSFAEARDGTIWIGFFEGGVARYRGSGLEQVVTPSRRPGTVPHVRALYFDSKGRLWFASEQDGLGRIDDPRADRPAVRRYGKQDGLASDTVRCVTEDDWGRLYVGTQMGVDRLEPASGFVRHFTSDDGLARGDVRVCTRAAGRLWFGTASGLSSYLPQAEPQPEPPAVYIEGVHAAGLPLDVSLSGETEVTGIELAFPGRLQIDFASVGFRPGHGIRYQYRLEGADRDWAPPTDDRSVNFASLTAGSYRFLVRAVSAEGVVSAGPASVRFRVVPPLWRRGWFLALVALLVALAVSALVRYRVSMLLELERVRTRIASDLHDDIGSSLSQIAVLGDVVRKRLDGERSDLVQPLSLIGSLSREAVDAMGDIVWAINPLKDHFPDLGHRMRRLASDLLPARGIEFDFQLGDAARDPRLGAEVRRETFLIFKEALNNAVRHSGCARIAIDLRLEDGWLKLAVSDDGRGLDPATVVDGHGLSSMRRRAERLGGTLEVASGPGTRIAMRVPVPGRRARHPRTHLNR